MVNINHLLGIQAAYGASNQAASANEGGLLSVLPLLILFFVIFYFLLIRPQNKRAKEHRELISKLNEEDEVTTSGGILGKITHVDENFITLKIAHNVEITVQKQSVTNQMPKGTIEQF